MQLSDGQPAFFSLVECSALSTHIFPMLHWALNVYFKENKSGCSVSCPSSPRVSVAEPAVEPRSSKSQARLNHKTILPLTKMILIP